MEKEEKKTEEVKVEEAKPEQTKKKGKTGLIIAIVAIILFILLIAIIAIAGLVIFFVVKPGSKTTTVPRTTQVDNKITITFETNCDDSVRPIDVTPGEEVNLPTPLYDKHTFDGWYLEDGTTQVTNDYEFTESITVYAHWTEIPDDAKTLTVTFDSKGGSKVKSMKFVCNSDNAATLKNLPTPKKDAYEFRTWEDKHGTPILNGALITCDGDLKLYAAWDYDGPTANPEQNPNPTWKCPDGFELNESTHKCTSIKKAEYFCETGTESNGTSNKVCYVWKSEPTTTTCKDKNGYKGTYIPNSSGYSYCGYNELTSYIGQQQNCTNNNGTLAINNHCYKQIELATESLLNHTCPGTSAYRTTEELGNGAKSGCYNLSQRTYGCKTVGEGYSYNYSTGKCYKTVDAVYE